MRTVRNRRLPGAKRRIFTRAEDELILANAEGRISQGDLQRELRCGTDALHRRASELGLQIRKYVYGRGPTAPRTRYYSETGEPIGGYLEVPHVGEDLLLKQLNLVCDRQYESLNFKKDENAN